MIKIDNYWSINGNILLNCLLIMHWRLIASFYPTALLVNFMSDVVLFLKIVKIVGNVMRDWCLILNLLCSINLLKRFLAFFTFLYFSDANTTIRIWGISNRVIICLQSFWFLKLIIILVAKISSIFHSGDIFEILSLVTRVKNFIGKLWNFQGVCNFPVNNEFLRKSFSLFKLNKWGIFRNHYGRCATILNWSLALHILISRRSFPHR